MELEKFFSATITILFLALIFRGYLFYVSKKRPNIKPPRDDKSNKTKDSTCL